MLVCLLGMAAAMLMLVNTRFNPGGAHTVGAADGGPGLPITGWSTQHGDLRIPHFVGLHALQVLPLIAWALQRYASALTTGAQVRLVRVANVSCAGVVTLVAWQAERGLPLLRPDGRVLSAGLVGLVVLAASVGAVVLRDRQRVPTAGPDGGTGGVTASSVRQVCYGLAAGVGLVLTWFFNLRYEGSVGYLAAWFANDASSSAAVDLLVVAATATLFVFAESRRLGFSKVVPAAFLVLGVLVAMAFAVPMFLLYRERRLNRERHASGK